MKVSVLLAVYNAPQIFLREAIASILNQTFADFEFIILDDASVTAEETERIVRHYSDPRIIFLKNECNLGISESYNRLIDLAQGEYLAIMNHDDIAFPERLEKQVNFMDANTTVGICGTGFKRFGNVLKRKTIVYPESDAEIKALMFFKCPVHHPSALIRCSVLKENGIRYDKQFLTVNDRKLYFDIAQKAQLRNLPEVLMKYRLHRGMATRQIAHVIKREQQSFREYFLHYLGVQLNFEETHVVDEYLTCGRNPIYNIVVLKRIETILIKLIEANKRIQFAGEEGFNKIMKFYFMKRCINAALWGRISSRELIKYSPLKINKSEKLSLLWLLNRLIRPQELLK
jgi:glycosyltransferase involved in cell wall biosynthesis